MVALSGSLFVIAAPSGAGKTSLVREVVAAMDDVVASVSHTTRLPRQSEQEGDSYFFIDKAKFDSMVAQDLFLEHARVHDHYYGTVRTWVLERLMAGQDVILEIDCQGALQVKEQFPDAVLIFIIPPSVAELKQRLQKRRQNTEGELERRMMVASQEVSGAANFDYLIVNADFQKAVKDIIMIISTKRLHYAVQSVRCRAILAEF